VAIQHVPFEGPGLIADVAAQRDVRLKVCRLDREDRLPAPGEIGGLVVMGGPMSVGDTAKHPHLVQETELIAAVVGAGRPVLGVCLGAQLLAHALGARVRRGERAEIGVGTVSLTAAGLEDPVLGSADSDVLPVMHWHGDTFDLPKDASWLARSALYPHQAFRVGENAYGLQFHIEVNRELAEQWRAHLPDGVGIPELSRVEVERVGRRVLEAFFDLAPT
jgi:GMP synthase (glutamine-hydrolysing)